MGDEKGFVDAFKKANSEYKSFKEAQSIDRALSDVFGDSLSEKSFQKLADPQNRPKLEKSLGKDLYNKVQPIAKDVEKTQSALNSIKAKEFWGAASKSSLGPLNFIVYAISPKLAAAYGVKKGAEAGRHVLGKILSNPQSEKDFKGVLKAIESLDFKAADNAASVLMSHLEGKDQPKEEELPEWMKLVEQ